MALWPAPRGRMDDWSVSATARAVASGQASDLPESVILTQARFFMDDFHPWERVGRSRVRVRPPWRSESEPWPEPSFG